MHKARILIVEDEGIVAKDIERALGSLGYVVQATVSSGEEAVKQIRRTRSDLVLMDIRIAGEMDGIQIAEIIRNRFHIPVVYLTAYTDKATLERAKISEPYGYIIKPFEERELQVVVEMALYKHKMERELEKSKESYQNLVENINDVIFSVDTHGIITYISPAVERTFKYRVQEIVGKSFAYFVHPDDLPALKESFLETLTGDLEVSEFRILDKDGSISYVRTSSRQRRGGGKVIGLSGVMTDITERKQVQEEIEHRVKDLQTVNEFAIKLAKAEPTDDIFKLIADELKEITGSYAAAVSTYNPESKKLILRYIAVQESILSKLKKVYGHRIIGMGMPLTREIYEQMMTQVVKTTDDLSETTFGAITRTAANLIQKTFGIGHQTGVALKYKGELVGSAAVLMPKGKKAPSHDLMNIFANVAAVSIQRKTAEDALRESEEKYRNIFELSPEAVVVLSKEGKILTANRRIYDWLGYEPERFVGKSGFELPFLTKDSSLKVKENFIRRMRGEDIPPYEIDCISKDGHKEVGRVLGSPIKEIAGNTVGDLIMISNVTAQKRAENDLKKKLLYEETVAFCSQALIEIANIDEAVRSVLNELLAVIKPSHVRIFNDFRCPEHGTCTRLVYEAVAEGTEAGIGNALLEHLSYEDFSEEMMNTLIVGDVYGGMVKELPKKERQFFKVQGILSMLLVPIRIGSEPWGFIVVDDCVTERCWGSEDFKLLRTVTSMIGTTIERRRAEEALRDSEEKLRSVVETAKQAIVSTNSKGRIIAWNRAAEKMFGYTPEEAIGKEPSIIMPPYFRKLFVKNMSQKAAGMKFHNLEHSVESVGLKKDGTEFPVEISFTRWEAGGENFFTSIISDITERKQGEEALKQSLRKNEAFLRAVPDMMFVLSREGIYLDFQAASDEELAIPREGIIGRHIRDTGFSNDYIDLIMSKIEEVLATGQVEVLEYELTINSTTRYFEARIVPLHEDQVFAIVRDITERKKAEEDLRDAYKAREELEQILNQSEAIIFLWRNAEDWPVEFVSNNIRLYGYSPEEWYEGSVKYANIVHPEDLSRVAEEVERYSKDGRTEFSQEYRIVTKKGSIRWVDDRTLVRRGSEGKITHYQGIILDITERKRAEEALRESEERFRSLVENMRQSLIIYDRKYNRNIYQSPATEEIFGMSLEEFAALGVKGLVNDVVYADDREKLSKTIQSGFKMRETGSADSINTEFRIKRPDGQIRWIDMRSYPRLKDGKVGSRSYIIFSDITQRKLAEEQIRYQADLVENVSDAITSTDLDFTVRSWNKAAEDIYGWKTEEVLGKKLDEVVGVGYLPEFREEIAAELPAQGSWKGEIVQKRKDGTPLDILTSISLIRDSDGEPVGIVSIDRDITERKRIEEKEREYMKNVMFLSKTAMGFVELSPEQDIYDFVGGELKKIIGEAFVIVNSFDAGSQQFTTRAIYGVPKGIEASLKLIGKNIVGTTFPITDEARVGLTSGRLEKVQGGIFQLAGGNIPKSVCHAIEKLLGLGEVYAMGFARKDELFGSANILLPQGVNLENKNIIETFISQTSVALQRRMTERALSESEKKYRTLLETLQEGLGVTDPDENITFANSSFCRMLGYSREEIIGMNVKDLIPSYERVVLERETSKRIEGASSQYELKMIRKNGEERDMRISAVPLIDENAEFQGSVGVILDITEQKQTQKALRESEERYRAFTEEALVGIYIYRNGGYLFVNKAMEEITGYTRQELLSKDTLRLGLPRDRNSLEKNDDNDHHGVKANTEYTFEIKRKNGEQSILEVRVRSIPYGKGIAYLGNCIDITERVRQREQIEQARKEWERTFDAISDMVMIVNPLGYLQKINRAVIGYTGITAKELIGRSYLDIFHLENKKDLHDFYSNVFKSRMPTSFQIRDPKKDNEFWISVSPLIDPSGNIVAAVGVARDVTQMHLMEQALIDSEMQFRGLAESAKDIIFNIDVDGSILYLNPAFNEILGYSTSDFIGKNLRDLLEPEGVKRESKKIIKRYLGKKVKDRQVPMFEITVEDIKRRRHILEISARYLSGQYIGIIRDVTERKKMEQQLMRASKLASVGVLAAGLAHQVNNPLASLMATSGAFNEMIAKDTEVSQELRNRAERYLKRMEEQLDRTHKIVSSLLEFAKEKRMDIRPQNANFIIRNSLQFLSQHLSFKKISLEMSLEKDLPAVMADHEALQEAIVNVVQNAYEAMEGSGKLSIRTEKANHEGVRILVTNNGPVIPQEIREEIFELLFTTKTDRKGTGLGLPISAMLLEHFGGRINLEESRNGETTFAIEVPTHNQNRRKDENRGSKRVHSSFAG